GCSHENRPTWFNEMAGFDRPEQTVSGPRRAPLLNPKSMPQADAPENDDGAFVIVPYSNQQAMQQQSPPPAQPFDYYSAAQNPSSAWAEPANAPIRKSF